MKIHHLTAADAFASLDSGLAGLSDDEARRRLVERQTRSAFFQSSATAQLTEPAHPMPHETVAAYFAMGLVCVRHEPDRSTHRVPAHLARLRFPKALDDRLHFLLDEQGRKGKLTPAEKKEAEGLVQMASMLSILKLGAQVKAAKS